MKLWRTFIRNLIAAFAFGVVACSGVSAQSCTVLALAPIFIGYDGTANNSVGSITVTCLSLSSSIAYSINLGASTNASGQQRRMLGGTSSYLNYNFHCDASAQPWFNGTGSCNVSGTFPLIQSHPVYGRIPAGQTTAPGLYGDNTSITVMY